MAALLFISFIVLLLIGVPVAFAIAAAALLVLLKGDVKLLILVQRMFASTDSFSLIAVPFFIFAGDLLAKGKVSKVLVEFAESLLGMLKGGLSIVSVLAGMFFAAISGSGAATTAAVGATLIPELKKRGYREDSAAALIAAAGTIGVVIPPSVPMVLYAVISEDSVNTLFKNGFIPGILMGVILVAISLYQARKFNYPKGKAFSVGNVLHTFKEAIWGILMPLIILGGIFSGYFTPSEAAAVAVIYAIFVSFFIYRDLDFKGLVEIMKGSAKTSAVIMIIIACSGPFGWVLANYKIPEAIASGVLGISTNKYVIMFLISLIILLAGVFMETSSAIIILSPVFLPLVKAMGISTVHFGILFVVGIAIGMITPPVAINLFVASGITGLPIERISKSVIPYLIGLIIVFFMIVYVPLLIRDLCNRIRNHNTQKKSAKPFDSADFLFPHSQAALCGYIFLQDQRQEITPDKFPGELNCLRFLQCGRLVLVEDHSLDHVPCSGIDRMGDIAVFAVSSFSARHRDKQAFLPFNDLDIVDHKLVVQCDGHDRLHLSLFLNSSHTYICYLHNNLPHLRSPQILCNHRPVNI